ncbi:MAG: ABC-2 transporter permease [Methanomicrobia archaeon]|nr:ABC-2 transporter permease [Methanomicrobia archaeon]
MFDIIILTLKQIYKSKKTYLLGIFLFLPLILGIYSIKHNENGIMVFSDMIYTLYLQLFVLLITLIFATSLIGDEIRSGKIAFLTTRVSRRTIVIEKYIGYLISISLVFLIPLITTFVVLHVYAPGDIPIKILFSYMLIIFLAVAVYGAFYLFISLIISRPLMFGLFFAFIWEIIAPNVSERLSKFTIMHHLKSVSYKLIKYGDAQHISNPSNFSYSLSILCAFCIITVFLSVMIFKQKSLE